MYIPLATRRPKSPLEPFANADALLVHGFPSDKQNSSKIYTDQHGKSAYFNTEGLNVTTRQHTHAQTLQKPRKIKAKYRPNYEKLAEKTRTKNRLCVLFREAGDYVLANKMRDCSNFFYALTTGSCIARTEDTFHCGSRHCPFCASIKAQRKIDNYLPKAQAFYAENASVTPIHLVLTQKHKKNEQLSDSIERLMKSFRKLIRRAFWKSHCAEGGLYTVEFTIGRDGNWHAHLHCLVFRRRYFHVNQFRSEWHQVTGDSKNFRIIPIDTLSGGLEEIIGYISKPADTSKFTVNHAQQLLDLSGVKMFGTFGDFRTFCASYDVPEAEETPSEEKPIEGDLCACHGLPLFRVRLDIKQRIELEREIYRIRKRNHLPFPQPDLIL